MLTLWHDRAYWSLLHPTKRRCSQASTSGFEMLGLWHWRASQAPAHGLMPAAAAGTLHVRLMDPLKPLARLCPLACPQRRLLTSTRAPSWESPVATCIHHLAGEPVGAPVGALRPAGREEHEPTRSVLTSFMAECSCLVCSALSITYSRHTPPSQPLTQCPSTRGASQHQPARLLRGFHTATTIPRGTEQPPAVVRSPAAVQHPHHVQGFILMPPSHAEELQ